MPKPGGLYTTKDLRWPPAVYERPVIAKAAGVFRSFSETREFSHSNAATQAAVTALAPQTSGCFLFQISYDKSRKDQVAVIQKR